MNQKHDAITGWKSDLLTLEFYRKHYLTEIGEKKKVFKVCDGIFDHFDFIYQYFDKFSMNESQK